MAIQVSGSTVIHDSQDVQVSGMFTASSFVGDASQLTNLPASGGTLEATASGTLADGSKVVVNTDGTVSVVTQTETTGPGVGSEEVFQSAASSSCSAVYDSSNNKVVIAYYDGSAVRGKAVVGTVSGTSISFGSPVVFGSGNVSYVSSTYDSVNNKVVITYQDWGNSGYGTAVVGTVSGTSISFGSAAVFNSGSSSFNEAVYDSSNNKVVITYKDGGNSSYGTAVVGTVSGTSINFGSPIVFESSTTDYVSATFDSSNGKVVIAYRDDGNSYQGTSIVGTVSGTSISFGSPALFNSGISNSIKATYDSTNNKVVIAYANGGPVSEGGANYYGTAIVGTVSGTSISFGSAVVFESAQTNYISLAYDSTNQKVVISYQDAGNSSYGTAIVGTVSGISINFDSPFIFKSTDARHISSTFDSSNGKIVIAYSDDPNSNYGTAIVVASAGMPVPQLGSPAVFESATVYQTSATFDSTNSKVVIAYKDAGNSYYGTAVVGNVSGTSISFGSPVIFESANIQEPSVTFDSSTGKVVIAYGDSGNSTYGTAIVGTVSGTSISFGTPVVFESASTYQISSTFDSTNNKVVISYRDGGNSYYGTAIAGTVSGTTITFGPANVFETSFTMYTSATFDSTNGKVVIAYQDQTDSSYGKVVVATASGTQINFGTPVTFESARTEEISAVYDSANQKVVIAYMDYGNSQYSAAIVGTVSGTSISFGSPTVFATNADKLSATYDSTNGKVVISYQDKGNSYNGTAISGTVSGTSITFGFPVVVESDDTYDVTSVYDSTSGKVVIAYRDNGNSQYGTAITFSPITMSTNLTSENYIGISNGAYSNGQTATVQVTGSVDNAQSGLTAGQAYYVQDDGTLGESGSVFAGTAVSASKIIVKG